MNYFAYGSNLCRADMVARCPGAVPLGRATLPGFGLVFRLWADIEPRRGSVVSGGLWRITPACRAALDDYEDVAGGVYRATTVAVWPEHAAGPVEALVYRMTATHRVAPVAGYLDLLARGYRDFGLDPAALGAAVAAASDSGSPRSPLGA